MKGKGAETKPEAPQPRQGYIPRPPTPEEVEQISKDQALITDEWAGEPARRPASQPRKP